MNAFVLCRLGARTMVFALAIAMAAPMAYAEGKKAKAWRTWNGEIPKAPKHVNVKKGETLSDYAGRYLWPLIWLVNQEDVENPHLIYPGQKINIPPNDGFVGGEGKAAPVASYGPPIAEVMFATRGEVVYHRVNGDEVQLYAGDPVYGPGTIHTESGGVLIKTDDGAQLKVYDHSQVLINEAVEDEADDSIYRMIDQKQGRVSYRLPKYPDPSYRFEVKTAVATVEPKSRFFQVDIDPGAETRISSYDGKLRVIGRSRFVDIPADHGVAISADGKRMAESRLPDTPVMLAPNGVTKPNVQFVWREVSTADRYSIQIGSDRAIIDLVFIGTIYDDTKFEMDIRNSGDYYWIVESVNELGFTSSPQTPMRFTVSDQFVDLDR